MPFSRQRCVRSSRSSTCPESDTLSTRCAVLSRYTRFIVPRPAVVPFACARSLARPFASHAATAHRATRTHTHTHERARTHTRSLALTHARLHSLRSIRDRSKAAESPHSTSVLFEQSNSEHAARAAFSPFRTTKDILLGLRHREIAQHTHQHTATTLKSDFGTHNRG